MPLMCLVVHAAEKFLRVFMFPSCGRHRRQGLKTVPIPCATSLLLGYAWKSLWIVVFLPDCTCCSLLQIDPRLICTYKHRVHLVLWTAQNIVGARKMLSLAQCSPEHSTVKSWRQQLCFILRQLKVSGEFRKFFLRDVVWFSRGYIQEKFRIVRWAVNRSYVIPSLTWKPEPVLSF